MVEIVDRVPGSPNTYTLTEKGSSRIVALERADEPVVVGTLIGRKVLMAMQGFEATETVFNEDGSITETNENGDTMVTTFNEDGSVVETFAGASGAVMTKTTMFNEDGSISEVMG